jgi:hypothetical protein
MNEAVVVPEALSFLIQRTLGQGDNLGERVEEAGKCAIDSGHPTDPILGWQWFGERRAVLGANCGGFKGCQGIKKKEET